MNAAHRYIHISPDWCGETGLVRLFRTNNLRSALNEGGDLAMDILSAQAAGTPPLAARPGIQLFAGLHHHPAFWRPPLEAWRSFAFLAQQFPAARFILTTRDPDAWILDRLTRDKGIIARSHAHHRDLSEADLPDLWRDEWHAHVAAVQAYFGDDPRLIQIDTDSQTLDDVADRLSLRKRPQRQHWNPPAEGAGSALLTALDRVQDRRAVDPDFAADVATFCLRGIADDRDRPQPMGEDSGLSGYYCHWDGRAAIHDRDGGLRRMTVTDQPGLGPTAMSRAIRHFKLQRAEGVINAALRLGRAMPLRIDMEDSRWLGSPQGQPVSRPIIGHNRRCGARNMVLWPLPGQHDIGMPGFDPAGPVDRTPFADKHDRLVWRGMISGSEIRDAIRPGPASHVFLRQLDEAQGDPDLRDQAWQGLRRTSRMALVERFFGHPDFDIGVVMAHSFARFVGDPLLAPYCVPRCGPDYLHRFRYQLCLTGYDHGSNFITAIDSQSVLMKEEDGWEVFYSGRFQPWKHYIPVARYCTDLEEKLTWARENPQACMDMSAAARAECVPLRQPATRRAILSAILDGLAAAG